MLIVCSTAAVFAGLILDTLFGDPYVWWHPICLIGKLIAALDNKLNNNKESKKAFFSGLLLVLAVTAASTLVSGLLLFIAYRLHLVLGFLLESFFCWFLLAGKCLKTESMKVRDALNKEGIMGGRSAVAMIVGRDTGELDEAGVIKATVETVAENTSDGVVAPLFYMLIGGAPLGFLYKSINTMDSMIGYKNEKYIYFGRCAAKLDDAANFIPARLSALFMIVASLLPSVKKEGKSLWSLHNGNAFVFSAKGALHIFRRDRKKHASPNSAQTESVMAGALGVQLAGDAVYFGKKYNKPFIGDFLRSVESEDISRANLLMYRTVFLFALTGFILKGLILLCMSMAGIFIII